MNADPTELLDADLAAVAAGKGGDGSRLLSGPEGVQTGRVSVGPADPFRGSGGRAEYLWRSPDRYGASPVP